MRLAAFALAALGGGQAAANGFYIPQQAPVSAGRSFAGDAALGRDASSAFFNPAALVRLERSEAMAHVSLIRPSVSFSAVGVDAATPGSADATVPAGGGPGTDPASLTPAGGGFLAVRASERLWFGLSLTTPFGLGLEYPRDYFGRYDSVETRLRTVNLSPVVAVDVLPGVLSVGGGVDVMYADGVLGRAVPDILAPGGPSAATDGYVELDGDDLAVGFNFGAHLTVGDTRVGLHYRSGMDVTLDGDARVTGLDGPLAAINGVGGVESSFSTPSIATLGVARSVPSIGARLMAEVRFFGWNAFDTLDVDADQDALDQSTRYDFRDSYVISAGGEWDATPALTLRAGAGYDRTPTIDQWRSTSLPDGDRIWLGFGASYAISGHLQIDAAVNGAIFDEGVVDRTDTFFAGGPLESAVRTRGVASLQFLTASIGLRWRF